MTSMGNLIELPGVAFPRVSPELAPVLLADGPCAGRYENVPQNVAQTWARVGKPGRLGVETQMWSGYERAPDGAWRYNGITVTTDQLYAALAAARAAGITHGESHGV
jgi:hypothetical protein